MKKKLLSLALATMIMSTLAYGTLAYFTSEGRAENKITTGNLEIILHDETTEGAPFPVDGISGVMPGDVVDKVVYVENTGGNSSYVRIKLEQKIDSEELSFENITLDINEEDWTYQDGWYYYNEALDKGELTEKLFTKVTFNTDMGNDYMNAKIEINVIAQAVQSKNNGDSALEALGWPKE